MILAGTAIHYYPFPGTVTGHPIVLSGSIEAIAIFAQAHAEHVHEQSDVIAAMLGKQLPKSSRCSATPTASCSPSRVPDLPWEEALVDQRRRATQEGAETPHRRFR